MSAAPLTLPRTSLAVTCLGHAALFSWAAATLPWRSGTTFAICLTVLAVLHAATAVTALLQRPIWLIWSWRALSAASLFVFVLLGWSIAAAALYVGKLYLRLGPSVAGGLVLVGVVLALLTLPIAIWGARLTWSQQARSFKRLGGGAGLLVALLVFTLPLVSSAARAEQARHVDAQLSTDLENMLEEHSKRQPSSPPRTVADAGAAHCSAPVTADRVTALISYNYRRGGVRSLCLQAETAHEFRARFDRVLRRRARPGSTVVVDLVRAIKPLSSTLPLLDALAVRPGLDGVCEAENCLPAWQLTLSDAFSENHPVPSMPDLSYGFSTDAVRKALGSPKALLGHGIDGLLRIETESFTADAQGVHRLVRTRATPPALSNYTVAQAVANAQRYIVDAQEPDGTFRYSLDPKTGNEDKATLNLPRQAGTTYALCELGSGRALRGTVSRALGAFAPTETKFGDVSALQDAGIYGLGKSALPLLSMLRCRKLAGSQNDRLIGQLARLMLKLQRENGSFYPELNAKTRKGSGNHEILYAAGQAVLSLVLLEQQLDELKGTAAEPLPAADSLKRSIDRAMDFYAGPYWPRPLRDFFFFEEGWHCLAARHALTSHRHDGYERFCIDYVASRLRYVARAGDTSEPNFVGGYGVSDMFPPRNTATSGLGEALNASTAIKQKRGEPVADDKAILRDLVSFLLRAQWTEAGCYACQNPAQVVGGFSQQLAAPDIRIDYVQHAMSAIGHGGRLLFPSG